MPLILAAPLPGCTAPADEARLSRLCARWERSLGARLSPGQMAHCRRFGHEGDALRARASRLVARLLALRVLPQGSILDRDERGRPRVRGASGWHIAFSHSGCAAFCLVLRPDESATRPDGQPALDAEAALPPVDRAFSAPAPSGRAALRRWVIAEALFKALGAPPPRWGAVAAAAGQGAGLGCGKWRAGGDVLSWRFLPAPGHAVCVALPGEAPFSVSLRWLAWQSFL